MTGSTADLGGLIFGNMRGRDGAAHMEIIGILFLLYEDSVYYEWLSTKVPGESWTKENTSGAIRFCGKSEEIIRRKKSHWTHWSYEFSSGVILVALEIRNTAYPRRMRFLCSFLLLFFCFWGYLDLPFWRDVTDESMFSYYLITAGSGNADFFTVLFGFSFCLFFPFLLLLCINYYFPLDCSVSFLLR